MHDTDPADLIEFATRWATLGDAVTEQVRQVLDDPSCGSCWNEGTEHGVNPAAIRLARIIHHGSAHSSLRTPGATVSIQETHPSGRPGRILRPAGRCQGLSLC